MLPPPVLSVGSYFTASTFEASGAQGALFLLPNSYVGMFGRARGDSEIGRFFGEREHERGKGHR